MTNTTAANERQRSANVTTQLPPEQWEFRIRLRRSEEGPELACETTSIADVLDAQCELWFDECLRKGRPDVAFDELSFRLSPVFGNADELICDGFVLRAHTPFGTIVERQFAKDAFADVALRAQQRLIDDKVLRIDDNVFFEIEAHRSPVAEQPDEVIAVESQSRPLTYLNVPLPPLLKRARAIGDPDGRFPVIYVEDAWKQSEQYSRRGALYPTPIETGGVQIGPLCSCPETGELFPVVCNVLEVKDAEESKFSLSYTGKSWARIQAIVQAMQSQPATRAHRILGQSHGHNFPPAGGAPPCDLCYSQTECPRRSDTVSQDDRTWSQAVFNRQPWHLCHIFGINARNDNVENLYTLRGNRLQSRGFYVIPDFELSAVVNQSTQSE